MQVNILEWMLSDGAEVQREQAAQVTQGLLIPPGQVVRWEIHQISGRPLDKRIHVRDGHDQLAPGLEPAQTTLQKRQRIAQVL